MVAAKAGYDNIVATLIDAGADVNKADKTGATPLKKASKAGHSNIVGLLMNAGAIRFVCLNNHQLCYINILLYCINIVIFCHIDALSILTVFFRQYNKVFLTV